MPKPAQLLGLFRHLVVYLDIFRTLGDQSSALTRSPLLMTRHKLLFFGADVVDQLSPQVTHVVVDGDNLHRFEELQNAICSTSVCIVEREWVDASIESGTCVLESRYAVHNY